MSSSSSSENRFMPRDEMKQHCLNCSAYLEQRVKNTKHFRCRRCGYVFCCAFCLREFLKNKYKRDHDEACKVFCKARHQYALVMKRLSDTCNRGDDKRPPLLSRSEVNSLYDERRKVSRVIIAFGDRGIENNTTHLMLLYVCLKISFLLESDDNAYARYLHFYGQVLSRLEWNVPALLVLATARKYVTGVDEVIVWREIATVLTSAEKFETATLCFARALRLAKRLSNAKQTASVLMERGLMYVRKSDYSNAETDFKMALPICEQIEAHSRDTLVCYEKLGIINRRLNRPNIAMQFLKCAMALATLRYGAESGEVATILANMATILCDQGHNDDAIAMFKRSLATQRRVYGADSIPVAETLCVLGDALFNQQQFDEAQEQFDLAVAIFSCSQKVSTRTLRMPWTVSADVKRRLRMHTMPSHKSEIQRFPTNNSNICNDVEIEDTNAKI